MEVGLKEKAEFLKLSRGSGYIKVSLMEFGFYKIVSSPGNLCVVNPRID